MYAQFEKYGVCGCAKKLCVCGCVGYPSISRTRLFNLDIRPHTFRGTFSNRADVPRKLLVGPTLSFFGGGVCLAFSLSLFFVLCFALRDYYPLPDRDTIHSPTIPTEKPYIGKFSEGNIAQKARIWAYLGLFSGI